jgi:phosphatidylinositol alpha-1,6-mannosyltransferase
MDDKKVILFVSHKHPPSIGGMENHNYHLKIRLEKDYTLIPIIIQPGESSISFFRSVRKRMMHELESKKIDSVYVNDGLLGIIIADLKLKFPNVKFISTIHGLDVTFPVKFYQKKLVPRLRHFDKLICDSRFTNDVVDKFDELKSKSITILCGNDSEIYKLSATERQQFDEKYKYLEEFKILLSIGRPVKRKGFSWFAKNVLPNLASNVRYLVVGPLPKISFSHKLRNFVLPSKTNHYINLGLGFPEDFEELQKIKDGKLILTGKVSYPELNYLIERADLFIVPNVDVKGDAEGFGLVALEGAIRNKVVLAADLQGLQDAISDQNNGFLLPSEDQAKWVEKVNYFLNDPQKTKEMGISAGKYTIENYSWDKMTKEYSDIFRLIV